MSCTIWFMFCINHGFYSNSRKLSYSMTDTTHGLTLKRKKSCNTPPQNKQYMLPPSALLPPCRQTQRVVPEELVVEELPCWQQNAKCTSCTCNVSDISTSHQVNVSDKYLKIYVFKNVFTAAFLTPLYNVLKCYYHLHICLLI